MNRREFFELINGLPTGDLLEIQDAYWLAKNAHRNQAPRDDGARYFEHLRGVALILIERGHRSKSYIIKALLHDLIEDTNTPFSVIVRVFGHDVWESLMRLSKYVPVFDPVTGQLTERFKKSTNDYFQGLNLAPKEDRLVKLADRLHNMRSMGVWPKEKQNKYAEETERYLLPIAGVTDPRLYDELAVEVRKVFDS